MKLNNRNNMLMNNIHKRDKFTLANREATHFSLWKAVPEQQLIERLETN